MTQPMRVPGSTGLSLITGGAGFVATNVADRLLVSGRRVRLFDNLSRAGVEENLRWIQQRCGDRVEFVRGDIRDEAAVRRAVRGVDQVFHFAAQVAVTTSLDDPLCDFAVNAGGTLQLLEAARAAPGRPGVTYASTNKVYGSLDDVRLVANDRRYEPADAVLRARGIGESRPLEFHSPYGCSKGAAEQYVLDYARTFDMHNTVLRMSCIYGPQQRGNADQGWVAHFLRCALARQPLTIYGDGRQVRDLLFIGDFVDALEKVLEHKEALAGRAFNLGGGARNAVSLRELIEIIEDVEHLPLEVLYGPWRDADQRYYVSDTARFQAATGWRARTGVSAGVRALTSWLRTFAAEMPPQPLRGGLASAGVHP
jgi:CDP-paratose 2-epimerase